MSALSDALEVSLLNHLLRATPYTPPGTLYVGLFTADPGESGVTSEVSGGSYARVAVAQNATNFPQCSLSAAPIKTNGVAITFPTATVAWGTITHWAIYDSATGGTSGMLVHGALASSRYVSLGDTPKIGVGAVSITMTNANSGGLTDFAKRKLLDLVFGNTSYDVPAAVHVAVGSALTGESLAAWTDSGYSRKIASFGAPSGGAAANTAVLTLNDSVVSVTGPLTHFGIYDDALLGNALVLGALGTAKSVPIGDSAKFAVGSIVVTFN
jgi:hypothetical protein